MPEPARRAGEQQMEWLGCRAEWAGSWQGAAGPPALRGDTVAWAEGTRAGRAAGEGSGFRASVGFYRKEMPHCAEAQSRRGAVLQRHTSSARPGVESHRSLDRRAPGHGLARAQSLKSTSAPKTHPQTILHSVQQGKRLYTQVLYLRKEYSCKSRL